MDWRKSLLPRAERKVVDVAGHTGSCVAVLLSKAGPADGVVLVAASVLDIKGAVLVEDGPLGLCVLHHGHFILVLSDEADEHDGEED